jgi:drug/metabolite transporter (DMT)-like permease
MLAAVSRAPDVATRTAGRFASFGTADGLLIATVLLWGLHFPMVKYAVTHGFAALVYATMRFGVGSAVFAGITKRREGNLRVRRRDLGLLVGVCGIAMYVNQIAFVSAVKLTNASTVALLFGTLPIFVALIGWRLGVERPHRRHWVAVAVSFVGVALVAADAQGGITGELGGILLGLVAPVTWAFYSVVAAPLMRRYSLFKISAVVGLAAIGPLLVTSAPQFASENWGEITGLAWAAVAYSTFAAFLLSNVMWFKAIKLAGPNRAALYANLQPFLGAVFAVLILSESMGLLQIIGGAVIAAGIVLARPERAPIEVVD